MKLFTKILARVIVLPLLLAAGLTVTALITVRIMFKPADLEAIVTNQFQELLKRPVQIESARLSLTGEIQIKGLRVIEPGPEAVDFITAEYIYATYRLLPLLNRKLEIDSVVLVSPRIELLRRADGAWNIADIFSAYRQAEGKNPLNKIDSAEIKDGHLGLTYLPAKTRYAFENFNATLADFKPGGDTPFHASVFFKSNAFRKPVNGRLYAEGTVNFAGFRWEQAELKGLRADLTLLDKTAKISGGLKNFLRPEISVKAETPFITSGDLAYLFSAPFKFTAPRSSWDLSAVFGSSRTAEVSVLTRPLNFRAEGTFDLSKSTPAYSFTVSAPPISLGNLKRYGVSLPMETPSGTAQLRLRIASRNGKPVFSRLFVNTTKAGFKYRNLSASGINLAALLSENFANNYANATSGKLKLDDNTLSGLKLKTEITKNGMLFNYSGKFNGYSARGRAAVSKPFTAGRAVDFIGYSANLVYSELKSLTFGIKELRGPRVGMPEVASDLAWLKTLKNSIPIGYSSIKILYKADLYKHEYMSAENFYAYGSLKNIAGDISKINGDISIKSGAGTFYDVQKTSEKDRVFYIFSLPLTFIHRMNRTGALKFGYKVKDISFNAIGGDYIVDGGKVEIRNSFLDGKEFSAYVSGRMDFNNETMDVKIYTMSGKYYSMGSLPEALTDSSGKPALAFTLQGKMADPEFKMISPKESGRIIREAAQRGADIDFARIDSFAGGKK
ncbi:MAG TPA: hypothetical protein DEQ38_02365 [Elusimicrobia bacterium]|nr:MAG: hypothetical protein A2089_10835 [Elusimicrobia bacterium GWD2_63_28]HCC46953.1 hypothetical protein [Elusimicrobiota bacterium]